MLTIKHTMQPYVNDRRVSCFEAVSYDVRTKDGYMQLVAKHPDGTESIWGGFVSDNKVPSEDRYVGTIYVMNDNGATVDVIRYVADLNKLVDDFDGQADPEKLAA